MGYEQEGGGRVIAFSEVCIWCWLTLATEFDAWVCIVCINSIYFWPSESFGADVVVLWAVLCALVPRAVRAYVLGLCGGCF